MKKLCLLLSAAGLMLSGCGGHTTDDYAGMKPKLDIREYLNGPLTAKGILYNFSGKADLMFEVKMTGSWKGNDGTLEEYFTYSDGRTDTRTWHLHFTDDTHFTATASDVTGVGKGSQQGNAMNMRYTLNAKRKEGGTISLSMDDWMYLIDEKTLINRTKMRKFGVAVGELVITFEKESAHAK